MSPVLAFTGPGAAAMRLPQGGLVDRSAPLRFRFDGAEFTGLAGDSLASALLANGVRLLGRSFKYHRPRGVVGAGVEEPNALVTLRSGARREPNVQATVAELYEGLAATSQNRFPSLRWDFGAVNGLAGGLFAAGFYYKTFMWPAAFWERVYEPLIRRAAGLGRAPSLPDPDHYVRGHIHCDVLVIGAGPAGLAAALAAGRAGARVVLAEQDRHLGGRLLSERDLVEGLPGAEWAAQAEAELRALPTVRLLPRTTVFGLYDGGTFGAVERVADHMAEPPAGTPRQAYWRIVARRSVLAAGAIEQPLVFPGNDRPGVMLAGAVRTYLNRYAVRPGRRAVVLAAGTEALRTIDDLQAAGVEVAALVTQDPGAAPRGDMPVLAGGRVAGTHGRLGLAGVDLENALGQRQRIEADLLCMGGGWTPNLALTCHLGSRPVWEEGFVPGPLPPGLAVAGAAAGRPGLDQALQDGTRLGNQAVEQLGMRPTSAPAPQARAEPVETTPVWLMPGRGKAFVDFQHDVTAADVALAHREGFRSVEHLKRYTTLGMATDQGKLSNLTGLALMARLTGAGIAATGTTRHRPPTTPMPIGALAGHSVGRDFRPTRLSPVHDWAAAQGAEFVTAGAWLRAAWFPRAGEDWLASATREVLATRNAAGLCDVSTLGKIELVGPDVGPFLDRLYINGFASLKPGRVRYGVMLREDGLVMDDGTVARLAEDRWVMTTTTAQAGPVLAHMEYCHQVLWPELDVQFATTTDQWAQMSLAGPRSRSILARVIEGDVSDAALPYMGCAVMRAVGVAARVFRISFSGERAYEVAVPARHGPALAAALMQAGAADGLVAYGVEALGIMRIEKGHPAGGELNGQTTARDLGMGRMMSTKKDFIGRALAQRPALLDPARPALVGLRPLAAGGRAQAGAHLLRPGAANRAENDEGWVTSAAFSPTLGGWIALGMLQGGAARHGDVVRAYDPVRGADTEVRVCPPCFVDPDGERLRG